MRKERETEDNLVLNLYLQRTSVWNFAVLLHSYLQRYRLASVLSTFALEPFLSNPLSENSVKSFSKIHKTAACSSFSSGS